MDTLTQVDVYKQFNIISAKVAKGDQKPNQKQEAQRATIVHLSTSFWNGTQTDTCNDLHEKHKLGGGRWVLTSCKVSLNSVQRFQRSRKCLSQSEAGVAILVFPSNRPKHTKLGKDVEILLPVKFRQNSVHRFQKKSKKCLSQSEARVAILVFWSTQKHKLGRGRWDFASCQVSLNSIQWFQRRSRKCEKLTMTDRQHVITIVHLSRIAHLGQRLKKLKI